MQSSERVRIQYDPEGAKHGVPWRVTCGLMTVQAAGYTISRQAAKHLSDSQWELLKIMLTGQPLDLVGQVHVHTYEGYPYVKVCAVDPDESCTNV